MKTKISREQLIINAKALGFDHTDDAALVCAAMVSDADFRDKFIRVNFEKVRAEMGL